MTKMVYGWAPITKIEDQPDGTVIVHGPMTSTGLDRDQQRFSQAFLDQAVPQWFNESGNIREQHDPKRAVGNALQVKRDDTSGVWDLAAHVVDSEAVKKVRNKVLKGFSIGVKQPHVTYGKADSPGGEIDGGIICETSVVDRPSNPATIFQVVKSDGDGDELQFEPGDGLIEKAVTHAPAGSPGGGQFLPGGTTAQAGGPEETRKGAAKVAVTGGGGGKAGGGGAKKAAKKAAPAKLTPEQRAAAAQAKKDQAAAVRAAAAKVKAAQAATKANQVAAAKAAKTAAKPAPRAAVGKPHQPSITPGPLERPAATTPAPSQPTQKADGMTTIEKSAWSEASHPRGPGGKFVSVGSLNPGEHHAGGNGMPVIGKTAAGKEVAGSLGHTEKHGWHVAQYHKGNEWMPVHEVRRYDPATDGPKWGAKAKVGDKVVGKSLADRSGEHTVLEHGVGDYGPTMKVRNDKTGEEYTSHARNFKKVKPAKVAKADEPDPLVGAAFAEIAKAGLSDEARMALEFLLSKADGDEFEGSGDVDPTEDTDPAGEADGEDDEMLDDPRVDALIAQAEAMQAMLETQADEIAGLTEKLDKTDQSGDVEPALTKVDEPDLIKAAVAEVEKVYEGRLKAIEADLTKALAMPEPGGPVQMRTNAQAALSQAREQADVRAQIDELTTKADQFRTTDRDLADGYDERARRLKRTLNG